MAMIKDTVRAEATAERAYSALTSPEGYRAWWSKNCAISERVGRESMLHFTKDGTPITMRFKIDALDNGTHVKWTCVAHDMPSWVGTTLDWKIVPAGGAVDIQFEHAGWADTAPEPVIQGWKYFLGSLKSYLETGTGQPW